MVTKGSSTSKAQARRKTFLEAIDSVTGHDEVAIMEAFGVDFWDAYDAVMKNDVPRTRDTVKLTRMLVVAERRHGGSSTADAYDEVMAMTPDEVSETFDPDGEADDPDAVEPSAAGNGEGTPA